VVQGKNTIADLSSKDIHSALAKKYTRCQNVTCAMSLDQVLSFQSTFGLTLAPVHAPLLGFYQPPAGRG